MRTLVLMMRKTMSIPSRCLTTLVRKRPIFRGIGKIDVPALGELRPLRFVEETGCERRGVFRGQLRCIGPDRLENPIKPPDGLRVDAEMDVGGAALLSDQKVLIDVRGGRRGDERQVRRAWGNEPGK